MKHKYHCEDCGANLDPEERCDCQDEPDTQEKDAEKESCSPVQR